MNPHYHPLSAASRVLALFAAVLVNVCGAAGIVTLAAVEPASPQALASPAPDWVEVCQPRQRLC